MHGVTNGQLSGDVDVPSAAGVDIDVVHAARGPEAYFSFRSEILWHCPQSAAKLFRK